jgi:hypothetical protein
MNTDRPVNKIHWNKLHPETPWETGDLLFRGEIPQVGRTYGSIKTAYPSSTTQKGVLT